MEHGILLCVSVVLVIAHLLYLYWCVITRTTNASNKVALPLVLLIATTVKFVLHDECQTEKTNPPLKNLIPPPTLLKHSGHTLLF